MLHRRVTAEQGLRDHNRVQAVLRNGFLIASFVELERNCIRAEFLAVTVEVVASLKFKSDAVVYGMETRWSMKHFWRPCYVF